MNQIETTCWAVNQGLMAYGPACALQGHLVEARKARAIPDVLLLCEHPHVITLGRSAQREHLRAGNRLLDQMNVEVCSSDRGGDVTYHGPGQIVAYPILDLGEHRRDVRWYVEQLEEVMIRTTADFGIEAKRVEGQRGAWVETGDGEQKIGALGVHLSRWVTSHGLAYNASVDLRYFDLIVPCGIAGKGVTSLEHLLGRPVPMQEVRGRLTHHFSIVFNRRLEPVTGEGLGESLAARTAATARVLTSMA